MATNEEPSVGIIKAFKEEKSNTNGKSAGSFCVRQHILVV